mgnify:CR=1 FL=1
MDTIKKLFKNPISLLGIFLILLNLALAVFAPLIVPPEDPDEPYQIPRDGFSAVPKPPSTEHPLGTTEGQYDILYGIIWGTRTAFKVGLTVVIVSAAVGIIIGTIAGYAGGILDEILMRITDTFLGFPYLIAAMVITVVLGKGLDKVIIALIAFGWMKYARVIRSEVLSVRENYYIEAVKGLGGGNLRIIFRHILPNSIYSVLIQASMSIGATVIAAASLSFLGIGVETGYADWGQMASFARNWIIGTVGNPFQYWYTIVFPSISIMLFVLGWNLLGDAVRDTLDPKMKRINL